MPTTKGAEREEWLREDGGARRWLPLSLIVISAVAATSAALVLNIWVDEAFTLHSTGEGVRAAVVRALEFEAQPPAYFAILAALRSVNESIAFARLFSVACIAVTMLLCVPIARLYVPAIPAYGVMACLALNSMMLWAAAEIRVYAMVILVSAVQLLAFHRGYLSTSGGRCARWIYVATSVIALYTQYYLVVLLAGSGLALVALRRWRSARQYVVGMVLVALAMLLLIPSMLTQWEELDLYCPAVGHSPALEDDVREIVRVAQGFVFGNFTPSEKWQADGILGVKLCLVCALAAITLWHLATGALRIREETLVLWVICATLLIGFVALRFRLPNADAFAARHASSLLLPLMLSIFALAAGFRAVWRRRITFVLVLVLNASYASNLAEVWRSRAKPGDWRRVAEHIESREVKNQPILLFLPESEMALSHYYKGVNPLVPLPRRFETRRFEPSVSILTGEGEIEDAILARHDNVESAWLVTSGPCAFCGLDFHCDVLEAYVDEHFQVADTRIFVGTTVRLLHKREGG